MSAVLRILIVSCSFTLSVGSQVDQNVIVEYLKHQVEALMHKFEIVSDENAELRNRVSALEESASREDNSLKQKGRRQLSPYVAFSAYLDHQLTGLAKGTPITYNRVITNEGSGYNGTTGIFEAPRSGLYLFSWSTTARRLAGQPAYDEWINLVLDGNTLLGTVAESREETDDNQGSNTIVLRVNAGQRVWTVHNSGYSTLHGADNERTTSFTGVLLFEYE